MKKTVLSVLKYLLVLSIGIALLLLALKGVPIKVVFSKIKEANFWWLGLSVLVSLFAFVSRAYRWNLLIEPLGYKPTLKNTTASLMVGYLANIAVPRLGEVSRCGSLSAAEKIPFDKLLGTVIVERVIDVLSLLIIIIITVAVQFDRVKNFFLERIYKLEGKISHLVEASWFLPIAVGGGILTIVVVVYFMRSKATARLKVKVSEFVKGIIEGVRSVRNIRSLPVFMFHTIFIWTMYYFMSYFCFFALDSTAGLGWQAGLLILVAGGIGMSAPVQGGVGTFEVMVSQGLFIYGVLKKDDESAYALMVHGSQVLVVILLGLISYIVLWFGNKKRKNANA